MTVTLNCETIGLWTITITACPKHMLGCVRYGRGLGHAATHLCGSGNLAFLDIYLVMAFLTFAQGSA